MKLILVLSIVLFWMLSCGSTESETEQVIENSHTSSGIEDYVFPIADSYLHISDSIGIDMGDSNYVFGAVSSATLTTDGNIAVLDLQKIVISLFTTDCKFIGIWIPTYRTGRQSLATHPPIDLFYFCIDVFLSSSFWLEVLINVGEEFFTISGP